MHSMFDELTLVIVLAVAISLIMRALRQPLMIGHIITGVLVGPAVLNIVHSTETIEIFAEFGVALLLFIIGLGLNLHVIKDIGKVAVIASLAQVLLVGGTAYTAALLIGYSQSVAFFIALALSLSSTIIVLKLLSDKKEQGRLYAKVSIGFLLVQDLLATLAVLFISSSASGHVTWDDFLPLAIKGGGLLLGLIIIRYLILPQMNTLIGKSQEFLFIFAIAWALGIASLSARAGFSLQIGALLAGVSLASMPYATEIASRLKPLRDFFIILHFVMLGALVNLEVVGSSPKRTILFSLIVLIVNPISVLIIMGLMGYTKRTSFKAGLSMTQVGEFSLILLAVAASYGYITTDDVSLITFVALVTIAASTYMILYADKIYGWFERYLRMFERRKAKDESERRKRYELVLFGYQQGGHEFLPIFRKVSKKFIVVDYDPTVIDELERKNIEYMYGDATDPDLLEELNLRHTRLVVSTIADAGTNKYLATWLKDNNPHAVFLATADNVHEAAKLYEKDVSYVMLPHYIGSEKIGAFLRRSELNKTAFKEYREQHLKYLQQHHDLLTDNEAVGQN
jgi:Kef-type K+ transport system membrane component KefB